MQKKYIINHFHITAKIYQFITSDDKCDKYAPVSQNYRIVCQAKIHKQIKYGQTNTIRPLEFIFNCAYLYT